MSFISFMNFDLITDASTFLRRDFKGPSPKGIFLTNVVRNGEVLYHVPTMLESLGVTLAGYIPDGGGLRFLRRLKNLHIWFEDDDAFFSTVGELGNLETLVSLEIGWTGTVQSEESYRALFMLLPRLPRLQKLSIYNRAQGYYFDCPVTAFNRCMTKLCLDELTLDGIEFEAFPREAVIFPASLRVLRLHNCDVPALDMKDAPLLECFCMLPMQSVRGLETLAHLHRLQKAIFGEDVITLTEEEEGCLSPALLSHYRIALPPHWKRLVSA